MGKHTAGPWNIEQDSHGILRIWAGSYDVASCYGDGSLPLEERHANAALISSAPDLLQALEMVHEALLHANRNGWTIKNDVFGPINAAIRKAKGA